MSSSQPIHDRTRLFARVLGPYLLIAALSIIGRASYMRTLLSAYVDDNSVWPWISGAFVLPMGLAVVVLHPYWRGVAATLVSALGWLTAIKGAALMAFPQSYLSMGHSMVNSVPWWQVATAVMAAIGLYLTFVGWSPMRTPEAMHPRATGPTDLPRAA